MAQFFKRTKTTVYHNTYFILCLTKYRLLILRKIDKSHSDWGICFLINICEHRYDFLYYIYLWFAQKDHRLPTKKIPWSSSVLLYLKSLLSHHHQHSAVYCSNSTDFCQQFCIWRDSSRIIFVDLKKSRNFDKVYSVALQNDLLLSLLLI